MLYTNETDRLLIVFKDNTMKIIDNVKAYGILANQKFFYFDGKDVRSFIPAELVLYFGSLEAWDDGEDVKDVKDQNNIVNKLREYIDELERTKEYFNTHRDVGTDLKVYILNNIITDLKNDVLGERENK